VKVRLHLHARARLLERGVTEQEVINTVQKGEQLPAKLGRTGFRRNFPFGGQWRDKVYLTKQIEVYAVREADEWLVITMIARYF
jgi:hypothetical protein